ncbi:MAG: hypothetical protein KF764_34465 [Labilithrix sp.]|nr:hypothetical protein [Labilithrix sp.]
MRNLFCSDCGHALLEHDGWDCSWSCHNCGNTLGTMEMMTYFVENVLGRCRYSTIKDGGEWIVHDCVGCESDTMVFDDEDGIYFCFHCGDEWDERDIAICDHGSHLFVHDGTTICSRHFNELVSDDPFDRVAYATA